MPAKTNDNATAGPAWTPAALPVSTKMPVPMTTPTPKTVRSIAPSRLRSWCVGSSVSAMDCSMVFVRHRFMSTSSTSGHGGAGSDAAAPAMKCPMVGAPRNPLYPVAGLPRSPRLRTRQLRLVGLDSLRRQLLGNAPTTTVDSPRSARTRQRNRGVPICGSVLDRRYEAGQRIDRGHGVVTTGERLNIMGESAPNPVTGTRHAPQHLLQPPLIAAESNERGAVVRNIAVRNVATEDRLLFAVDLKDRSCHMAVGRHDVLCQFDAIGLGATHRALLLLLG